MSTSTKIWIRQCRVGDYFDMGNTLFNGYIKPLMNEMNIHPLPVGKVSKFYRRVDLDRVEEEYVKRSGQSKPKKQEKLSCKNTQDCQNEKVAPTGKSTKRSVTATRAPSYEKARKQALMK